MMVKQKYCNGNAAEILCSITIQIQENPVSVKHRAASREVRKKGSCTETIKQQ